LSDDRLAIQAADRRHLVHRGVILATTVSLWGMKDLPLINEIERSKKVEAIREKHWKHWERKAPWIEAELNAEPLVAVGAVMLLVSNMKIFALLLLLFPLLNAYVCAKSQPLKVFILAGQSNMEGQGVVSMNHEQSYNGGKGNLVWSMANSASKEKMTHLRDDDRKWVVRDDVEISFKAKGKVRRGGLTIGYTGYGRSSHIGPELQFGHIVGDHFDEPVLLIKTAWGGKSLNKDFRPPSSGGEVGAYYKQMIEEVRTALGDQPHELVGFIWMQGWNDMVSKEATAEYETNLVNLAKDIRAQFKSPKLPFVVGELGNGGAAKEGSGMQVFREAQKRGASKIGHSVFVATAEFARPKELSPNVGHGHHWCGNAESYFLVGDALGRAALQMLEGSGS
jgi:hypothetical protein